MDIPAHQPQRGRPQHSRTETPVARGTHAATSTTRPVRPPRPVRPRRPPQVLPDGAALGRSLPWYGAVALALLAVPRVVLHDLHLIAPGSVLNAVLAVVPPLVWVVVAVVMRLRRPFLALLAVGAVYGVLLAVLHLVLWDLNVAGADVRLGGNFEDLTPAAHVLITRGAATVSSLFTGVAVGAVTGLAAGCLRSLLTRSDREPVRGRSR
ncbi:hypothetical protein Q7C18_03660 [Nesterenkonia sp. CL21]|uniref:hypothetical protein n=1 Tax=Nesterenkonia sp. CL21 TaxID=3064894 RepID=UPI00287A8A05|nr:hypothetical protein [Nesterenkonia sp. CL21]MDS2171784.1 hypothetical protein [Nesterenkonia sp. CL21]